jgi:tetratricopeptide (TPR) repeat protein
MSDSLRTDGLRAQDDAPADRDAKMEQLLLVGLDHYFAARYELAINVWSRALFLDRSHARARAYIERARSALAERQRESEELVQKGVAAFDRGESNEARRLLQTAIDRGAPTDEALAVLERLNRLENTAPIAVAAPVEKTRRRLAAEAADRSTSSIGGAIAATLLVVGVVTLGGWAVWTGRADVPAPRASAPIAGEVPLPLPRRGEESLSRARTLASGGHLREALVLLESVRVTDPQRPDADRLRGDIQRQLLTLTPFDRRNP